MIHNDDVSRYRFHDEPGDSEESYASNITHSTMPIAITFCYRRGRTVIFKSVISALGNPDYIRMLINPEEKVVIVQICDKRERNVIEVPRNLNKDGVSFGINSVALLESMTKLMGWSKSLTYRAKGELQIESGFVVFFLEKAEVVNEADGGDSDAS